MCDDELDSLVSRLRCRYDELECLRPLLNACDRAELKVLGEIISFLEDKTHPSEPRKAGPERAEPR